MRRARCRADRAMRWSAGAGVQRANPRSAAMILPNFIAHPGDLDHLTHGMYAHDVCTGEHRCRHRRCCRPIPSWGWHVTTERLRQKPFPRWADEQRPSQLAELVEPRKRLVGVARLLRKAEARVDNDALQRNPGAGSKGKALAQLVEYFVDNVVIVGFLVHVPRSP